MDANKFAVLESAVEDLKRELQEEYERNLALLDGTLLLLRNHRSRSKLSNIDIPNLFGTEHSSSTPAGEESEATTPNGAATGAFRLKDEVGNTIREFREQEFTQRDVTTTIREKYPDETVHPGSVSTALGNLVKSGQIEVVREGRGGSDPNVYREVSVSP